MPIEVTENFSAYRFSRTDPYTGEREFMVTGTTDEEEALDAVDEVSGVEIPQANAPIRVGSPLLCSGPRILRREAPDFFVIGASYGVPAEGKWPSEIAPLSQPPSIQWSQGEILLPTDIDLDGRSIVNAAGSPFTPPSRRVTFKQFTIFQNEPFYNFNKAEFFENAVSSKAINLGGGVVVPANKLRCSSIIPSDRYNFTQAQYVPMAYTFEMILSDDLGPHPWQHGFLNAGRNGWVLINGKPTPGKFVTKPDGVAIDYDVDVRLDLSGKPMAGIANYDQIKIGSAQVGDSFAGTPVASPEGASFLATEQIQGTQVLGWRVFFRQFKSRDFAGILAK